MRNNLKDEIAALIGWVGMTAQILGMIIFLVLLTTRPTLVKCWLSAAMADPVAPEQGCLDPEK